MTEFGFEPFYGSILAAITAAVTVIAVIILFAPRSLEPRDRRRLIIVRSVAALALLLAAFRPSLIRTDKRPADATIVVACDISRSMTLPDTDNADRWATQQRAWKQLAEGLTKLDDSLQLQLVTYASQAQAFNDVSPDALDKLVPKGESTDMALATSFALQTAGANPLAGIVFMGDGRHTARKQTDDSGPMAIDAQRTVETLNSLGVPFWAVPIGPSQGNAGTRDVAIEGLAESLQLFAGNQFEVSFQVEARGLAGVDLPIAINWIDQLGKRTEAKTRLLVAEKSDETIGVTLDLLAPEPGAYRLEVSAKRQSGELVTQNNQQSAFVDVRAGGGRILYVEGSPRPEQSFLRQTLRRFPDLDLRYKWLRQDMTWPVDLEGRFKPGKFDVVILGDLDFDALGDRQLQDLADAVAAGTGLVTLGGYQSYGRGGYAKSNLAKVLPVKMDALNRRDLNSNRDRNDPSQLSGPIQLRLARNHPITDLGGDQPASIWQELPTMPGANRLAGAKVAPAVQILLKDDQGRPMMVVGEYGKGRVASIAFDSTWRWWRAGKSDIHRRFWRQTLLWLLSREETGGEKILIELESRRFARAQPPKFRARVESTVQSGPNIRLQAEIVAGDNEITPLKVSIDDPDDDQVLAAISGELPNLDAGFYRLRVKAPNSANVEPSEMAFQVVDESREMSVPMADPVYLRQLAEITADHGGAAFAADEIDTLLEVIAKRRKQAETPVVEKLRLGDGALSGWILFLVFAASLSIEWYMRRNLGLA